MEIILISLSDYIWNPGLRVLSACLKRRGHDVRFVFLTGEAGDKTLNELIEFSRNADLIGISLMTELFGKAVRISQKLKECSDTPIIWGGIHPTIRPLECLDYADLVCVGEGEEAVVEIAERIEAKKDFYNIPGVWAKNKDRIFKNELRPLTKNLDSIPFADWDYRTHFIQRDGHICEMTEDLLKNYINYPTADTYLIMSSRGCPFGCTYCINNTLKKMWPHEGKIVRKRSVDNTISELIAVKKRLPFIKCVLFDDDSFFIRTEEEVKDFCDRYKKNVGLPLAIYGISPSVFSQKKLSLLVDAGLAYIRMGVQTGNERIRRLYKRYDSNKQIQEGVRSINRFKDKIKIPIYDIILDNPWETEDEVMATLMFLSKLPTPYHLELFSLTFFPGTELYIKAKDEGMIGDDQKDVYNKSYMKTQKTYLNDLFFLLSAYAQRGQRISPPTMLLLTNEKLRRIRVSQSIYMLLTLLDVIYARIWRTIRKIHRSWNKRYSQKPL